MQAQKINVLLVEDDADDYGLFKEYLEEIKLNSYNLTWADNYEKALALIKEKPYNIYFFDYLLGAKTGLDLIMECLSQKIEAPFILLTGLGSHETDMLAMESGAADYLVKDDINAEKLERCIRYSIERNHMLKEIKESETNFRSIFENSDDVIFITDQNGTIINVNKSAQRIFGYTHEELLQMNSAKLYANEKDMDLLLKTIHKTGIANNFEITFKDKQGNKKYCNITSTMQRRDEKGNIFYQNNLHDMTRRKKAEQNLVIAEKLAISGRFARTLAHEIRNPLTNINLAVEQVETDIKDDEYTTYFEVIKRNSKRINDLVTELMEVSKPAELKTVKVSVNNILQKTVLLVEDRAILKGVKIETNFSGESEMLEVDEPKLIIALLNIMINAIEAVEAYKGVIKISSNCDGKACIITIEDNGPGIVKENQSDVFEPYYSIKNNGIGLGLSFTHNIITTHQGTIEVESEPGKGTKFIVSLNIL